MIVSENVRKIANNLRVFVNNNKIKLIDWKSKLNKSNYLLKISPRFQMDIAI